MENEDRDRFGSNSTVGEWMNYQVGEDERIEFTENTTFSDVMFKSALLDRYIEGWQSLEVAELSSVLDFLARPETSECLGPNVLVPMHDGHRPLLLPLPLSPCLLQFKSCW